ncbi:Dirigent protein [Forsythia ovata]|uniref:Dirigent protein n=1 Tax=Forsythia ovata TaxID=205694 RepID=A0ABD1Q0B8_9LAMI
MDSGEYPTVVKVAEASSSSNSTTNFGRMSMLDDLLTVGPEPDSQKLGRAQGTIGFADLNETSLQMVVNLAFTEGKYANSTISILGRNPIFQDYRELPIVGGTGVFRLARGTVISNCFEDSYLVESRDASDRPKKNLQLKVRKLNHANTISYVQVQQEREPTDVDFCSIAIDGSLENDILQQRLHTVLKQREQLQHMEIGLRAQEQLHKRGQQIHELERKIEEKEREFNAIRLDNEDAWAKEDLLREQSKEL